MLKDFKWSRDAFKNVLTLFVISLCFWYMHRQPDSRGEMLILITLVLKYYYDGSKESSKKDETINSMANSIPDASNKK